MHESKVETISNNFSTKKMNYLSFRAVNESAYTSSETFNDLNSRTNFFSRESDVKKLFLGHANYPSTSFSQLMPSNVYSNNSINWLCSVGLPLTVVNLPTTSSITALHFIPTIKDGTCAKSYPSLLACCADGALYMMKYSDEGQTTIVNLPSR